MAQLKRETEEKVRTGQAKIIRWNDIKHDFPKQLKVSPVAMVPHKSRKWRAILDLSFRLRLKSGETVPSVNENTEKSAPQGALDQLGHSLDRIIHAFAQAGPEDKVFMAKWDVKDGFWRLDEFRVRPPAARGRARPTGRPNVFADGLGGVTVLLLRGVRDGAGHCPAAY